MDAEARLKRLRIRGWRRGTKEMDLILGPFCDAHAEQLEPGDLDLLEVLMEENDQDLYRWVSTQASDRPDRFAGLLDRIARHAGAS